jgi:molybdenum-dependent DNA-binding transcriptional regulator ModE
MAGKRKRSIDREYPMARNGPIDVLALGLARGLTIAGAAKDARMSERTAFRRMQDADFQQRVADIRRGMLEGAMAIATTNCQQLIEVIVGMATNPEEQSGIRLKAAVEGLKAGQNLREEIETSARLKKIEEALGLTGPTKMQGVPDHIVSGLERLPEPPADADDQ